MGMTEFPLGHALAVQRWSTSLAIEAAKNSYFSKFIGSGNDSIIVLKNELQKGAGEKITVGLRNKLSAYGVEGDAVIEGDATGEEALSFFNDAVFIDQLRKSTKSKGKMSEQRVPYNMRKEGRDALAVWWAEIMDELMFVYLSGARGIDPSYKLAAGFGADLASSFANNLVTAPNAGNLVYAGDASSKADLDASDVLNLGDIERLVALAETTDPMIQGINIGGEKKFVFLMHTFQAFQLRTSTTTNDWLDIHKATDRGGGAMMYKNALGEYANVVLHKHRNAVRFDDYGAGADLDAARALFLGAQAGLVAYGQNGSPQRYSWNEDKDDRGNALAITAGAIFGTKKARFNSKDFGVVSFDSYCPAPA